MIVVIIVIIHTQLLHGDDVDGDSQRAHASSHQARLIARTRRAEDNKYNFMDRLEVDNVYLDNLQQQEADGKRREEVTRACCRMSELESI